MDSKLNELSLREEWMKEAREMTLENLPKFIDKIMSYEHEYGTIPRAIAAVGVAAAYAIQHSPQGGITGFQASCVTLDWLCGWDKSFDDDLGFQILRMEKLLYPQYDYHFNTLPKETFEKLQERAKQELDKHAASPCHPEVMAHWQSIINGKIPFGLTLREE